MQKDITCNVDIEIVVLLANAAEARGYAVMTPVQMHKYSQI